MKWVATQSYCLENSLGDCKPYEWLKIGEFSYCQLLFSSSLTRDIVCSKNSKIVDRINDASGDFVFNWSSISRIRRIKMIEIEILIFKSERFIENSFAMKHCTAQLFWWWSWSIQGWNSHFNNNAYSCMWMCIMK